jgi:hypothetical protein
MEEPNQSSSCAHPLSPFVRDCIKGGWFDGSRQLIRTSVFKTRDFAPSFVLANFEKYTAFLVHPNKRNSSRITRLISNNSTELYKETGTIKRDNTTGKF